MYIRGGTGAGNTGVKSQQKVEKENVGSETSKLAWTGINKGKFYNSEIFYEFH